MESQLSPAEELPALYRGILDGVARLEGIGRRREAASLRAEATAIYSTSWDDGGRRRLLRLQHRIDRIVEPRPDRAHGGFRWRTLQRTVGAR